jgi:hypothetical protein
MKAVGPERVQIGEQRQAFHLAVDFGKPSLDHRQAGTEALGEPMVEPISFRGGGHREGDG